MSEEKSLSPTVDELEDLIKNQKNAEHVKKLLEKLRSYEKRENLIKQAREFEENSIKYLEASKYYQISKEMIGELKIEFSAGYFIDIDFDKDNKLESGAVFNIRHTGTQYRHITPVAIIEIIIKNTLKTGATPEEISKALLFEIELFIQLNQNNFDIEEKEYFQHIVDYFKNKNNYTPQNVKFLVKLAAHFYNQILVSVTDNYISIPYNTNNCYLISTFEFTPKAKNLYHAKEGSFISSQIKILDGFNKKAEKGQLKKEEINKLVYTIFSIFDFLPLPENARDPKGIELNEKKDRYQKEPIKRLFQLSANHLLFVIGAYPNLWLHHKNAIIYGFLQYVANGVRTNDLLKVMSDDRSTQTLSGLTAKLGMEGNENTEKKFTNKGIVKGFAKQYEKIYEESKQFFESLYQKVLDNMKKADTSYYTLSPIKSSIKNRDKLESDYYYQEIESVGSEVVYQKFKKTRKFSDINKGISLVAKILKIKEEEFQKSFEKKFLSSIFLKKEVDQKFKKTLDNFTIFEDKFNNVKLNLFDQNQDDFFRYVHDIISETYEDALKQTNIQDETSPKKSNLLKTLSSLLPETKEKKFEEEPDSEEESESDDPSYIPGYIRGKGLAKNLFFEPKPISKTSLPPTTTAGSLPDHDATGSSAANTTDSSKPY